MMTAALHRRQAVGPQLPKGGEAYANYDHTTYPRIYSDDSYKRQKPPPWPVTVSLETLIQF